MTLVSLPRPSRSASRVVLFAAEHFPSVDAPAIASAVLEQALSGLPVLAARSPDELGASLGRPDARVLLLPHGSAFPLAAWPAIAAFLAGGGSLVVLGGAPFHQPVRQSGRGWQLSPRQSTYARELLIGPAEAWQRAPYASYSTQRLPGTGFGEPFPDATTTWSLTFRLATRKDTPDDDGSAGPRDAVVRPLVHVVDEAGLARGCPLLEVDRLRGDAAGARWVLAPSDAVLTAPLIRALVQRALEGASEIYAVPVRACVEPGEPALLRVTRRRPRPYAEEAPLTTARVRLTDDAGRELFAAEASLSGPTETTTGVLALRARERLAPGLYHVAIELPAAASEPRRLDTGFWVRDPELLGAAPALSASRDWLRKDGAVFPIVGTTYMASDVHRKFLFEPNPHLWDRDFSEMARRGVNFVRTGLWTAWGRVMLDPGAIDEGVLAALDAFVLGAAKHRIVVCFNFFAFLPPAFSGDNPYLDPRALEGQRELCTLFASRYAGVGWVHWDLINEPSYAPRAQLWRTRAIGDAHERRAFAAWVRERHGDDPLLVAERWRDPEIGPGAASMPPRDDEFGHHVIREGRRPRKVRDFREFTQDAVAHWASALRDVLRAAGDNPLVTLGQDEGGTGERPTQQLMGEFLDYTAVHTWWNNDDLLWDGVVTKRIDRASLHQETGLMRLEDVDGTPWRSPEMAGLVLERKVAHAFAARGAGVIEWAWNINPYQPIDNESVIGLIRPDGTAKPELGALTEAAEFFAQAAPWLDDFEPDPVLLVIPHARQFLGRPYGIDPSKVLVRVLAERFGVVPSAVSDLRVNERDLLGRKLVIVPAPEVLDEGCARSLSAAARSGTRVLITGAVDGDSYGSALPALSELGLLGPSRAIASHERSRWSPEGPLAFEGLMTENIRRSLKPEPDGFEHNVWHEPLPLELARQREPLVRLLGAALEAADVAVDPSPVPVAARALYAPRAALLVVVNETPEDARRRLRVDGVGYTIPVRAYGARLALVDRSARAIIAATPGDVILTE